MLGPESGEITVKQAGTDEYATLEAGTPVPVGSTVDATAGTVRLIAQTSNDTTQDVVLRGAKFEIRQAKDGSGITEFVLKGEDFSACGRAQSAATEEAQAAPLALGARPRRQVPHAWAQQRGDRPRHDLAGDRHLRGHDDHRLLRVRRRARGALRPQLRRAQGPAPPRSRPPVAAL